MSESDPIPRAPIRIVLGDANVLYSRALRDYLLYAAARQLVSIRWSPQILDEVVEHLIQNVAGFDAASGSRLTEAMNHAFPQAETTPDERAYARLEGLPLPDPDDRHVIAASLTARAQLLCTNNIKDFPPVVMAELGIVALTADELLELLITESPAQMKEVHRTAVSRLPGATDSTTIAALVRAGAPRSAELMADLLEV